jgi:hypothetical protein
MIKQLSSGIDTLNISFNVEWKNENFFNILSKVKKEAIDSGHELPITIDYSGNESFLFSVNPYGTRGYEWLLTSKNIVLKIGKWLTPMSRPSVVCEFSSEGLWNYGVFDLYNTVLKMIELCEGIVLEAKVSRVDLCKDIMIDAEIWDDRYLREFIVSRAEKKEIWFNGKKLETFNVGSTDADIKARLYDKPTEIKCKSKKYWMYDIWKIKEDEIPEDKKVIRIEFQIRREVIKELQAGSVLELLKNADKVWNYCVSSWLQFKDNPDCHADDRKTLDWWEAIQNNFMGSINHEVAIREKSLKIDADQLTAQVKGLLSSLVAIQLESDDIDVFKFNEIETHYFSIVEKYKLFDEKELREFCEKVILKRPRYFSMNKSKIN